MKQWQVSTKFSVDFVTESTLTLTALRQQFNDLDKFYSKKAPSYCLFLGQTLKSVTGS